jgi:hypothetical protein
MCAYRCAMRLPIGSKGLSSPALWIISGPRGTKGEHNRVMQGQPKLTPIQVLERLQLRLEQRMESLQRVKLDGYHVVISELETELDLLRRAQRYLED